MVGGVGDRDVVEGCEECKRTLKAHARIVIWIIDVLVSYPGARITGEVKPLVPVKQPGQFR